MDLLLTLTLALGIALTLGAICQRLRVSPIVGYLVTGVAVGPFSPGITANIEIANQLAEVGVVLLMFTVGIQFRIEDLWAARRVALPGAILQAAGSIALGGLIGWLFWGSILSGLVLGVAISVSSTVVMARVLLETHQLDSRPGRIALGWTVVEDWITVMALVLLPSIAAIAAGTGGFASSLATVSLAVGRVILLFAIVLLGGGYLVPRLMGVIAKLRSRELFTLATLVVALGVAVLANRVFGVSNALGAFLAGIVVGRSRMNLQAASDALPFRDAFAALFFVAMGMLFNPATLLDNLGLTLAVLAIVLVGKPLMGFALVQLLGSPTGIASTVALCLAQIGEFSFILANFAQAIQLVPGDPSSALIPAEAYSVLISVSVLVIPLNPMLVRLAPGLEGWFKARPHIWRRINRFAERRPAHIDNIPEEERIQAIVVGYGPVGRTVTRILRDFDIEPMIIELNLKTVEKLSNAGEHVIFGDASRQDILVAAGVKDAEYLVVTLPELLTRAPIVATARLLNPDICILSRARYLQERLLLEELGASTLCFEEGEVAAALGKELLECLDALPDAIDEELRRIRSEMAAPPAEASDG